MYSTHSPAFFVADGGVDSLLSSAQELAAESSPDVQKTLNKQIDQAAQNPSARNLGQLAATVQAAGNQVKTAVGPSQDAVRTATNQTNTPIDPAEVAESLRGKGIPAHKIDTLAEAIVARTNGQDLTQSQKSVLHSELGNSNVQNIISDLVQKKSNGVDSAQNDVYDEEKNGDVLANEESTVFHNHDYGKLIDGAALHQFQDELSEEISEGDVLTSRPTWRQSELDAVADFPDYSAQKSFIDGQEVPYGTKGSVRPDYYKSGFSVDIKNYNVESASGRNNLARNVEAQYYQRGANLPDGTNQSVVIDIRGQHVAISALIVLYNDIMQRTDKGVEILFKIN